MSQKLDKLVQDLNSVKAASEQSKNSLDSLTNSLEKLDAKIKSSLVGKSGEIVKYPRVTNPQIETVRERFLSEESQLTTGSRTTTPGYGTYRVSRAKEVVADLEKYISKVRELYSEIEKGATFQEEGPLAGSSAYIKALTKDIDLLTESYKRLSNQVEEYEERLKYEKELLEYGKKKDTETETTNLDEISSSTQERLSKEEIINRTLKEREALLKQEYAILDDIEEVVNKIASSEVKKMTFGEETDWDKYAESEEGNLGWGLQGEHRQEIEQRAWDYGARLPKDLEDQLGIFFSN